MTKFLQALVEHYNSIYTQRWYDQNSHASAMVIMIHLVPAALKLQFTLELLKSLGQEIKHTYKIDEYGPVTAETITMFYGQNKQRWHDKIPVIKTAFEQLEILPPQKLAKVYSHFVEGVDAIAKSNDMESIDHLLIDIVERDHPELAHAIEIDAFKEVNLSVDFRAGKKKVK